MVNKGNAKVSVVILTFNEEANISYALESVKGWSDDIHVVDSGSTDRTLEIVKSFGVQTHYNPWTNWAVQRNWSLDNCSLKYSWVIYLDADEQLTPESRQEIADRTSNASQECQGFYVNFLFYFLGKRVRNAMNPHLMLIRTDGPRWYIEGSRDYPSAPKDSPTIKAHLVHNDHRGIKFWSEKFIYRVQLDAESLRNAKNRRLHKKISITVRKRRFIQRAREFLYDHFPPFIRALIFFLYRLFFKTDLRDGWAGFAYTFFFGLWYPMLVDAMYIELCARELKKSKELP